ncbi:MAG: multidrug effflux MFS transporter, partial [Gammaproteobacteria bacterium]|nr:multidrug effflux MFS transporter [Gammaproteobacteria bacterium]
MQDTNMQKSKNQAGLLFAFLIMLISGPELATDMYIPSLPAIAHDLHILKSSVAMTITAYLLGMGIFQFFYGGFSDSHGRRKTLLISTVICLAGNVIALSAHSLTTLLIGRFVQGAGAGAGVAMSLAIARDVYTEEKLSKAFSILFSFYFTVFSCAPIIGGYLQHYLNWRYNFIILAVYFAIQLLWTLFIYKETATIHHTDNILKQTLKNYLRLFKSRVYMGNLLASTLVYSGLFAYMALTPFLFQKEMGLNAVEYGWLGLFIGGALISGNFIGGKTVSTLGTYKPNYIMMSMIVLGSVLMFGFAFSSYSNIWIVMIPFAIYISGIGISGVTCPANALTPFGDIAGSAGALWGGLQFILLFLSSLIYAHLGSTTQMPFSVTLIVLAV